MDMNFVTQKKNPFTIKIRIRFTLEEIRDNNKRLTGRLT